MRFLFRELSIRHVVARRAQDEGHDRFVHLIDEEN